MSVNSDLSITFKVPLAPPPKKLTGLKFLGTPLTAERVVALKEQCDAKIFVAFAKALEGIEAADPDVETLTSCLKVLNDLSKTPYEKFQLLKHHLLYLCKAFPSEFPAYFRDVPPQELASVLATSLASLPDENKYSIAISILEQMDNEYFGIAFYMTSAQQCPSTLIRVLESFSLYLETAHTLNRLFFTLSQHQPDYVGQAFYTLKNQEISTQKLLEAATNGLDLLPEEKSSLVLKSLFASAITKEDLKHLLQAIKLNCPSSEALFWQELPRSLFLLDLTYFMGLDLARVRLKFTKEKLSPTSLAPIVHSSIQKGDPQTFLAQFLLGFPKETKEDWLPFFQELKPQVEATCPQHTSTVLGFARAYLSDEDMKTLEGEPHDPPLDANS